MNKTRDGSLGKFVTPGGTWVLEIRKATNSKEQTQDSNDFISHNVTISHNYNFISYSINYTYLWLYI